MPAAIAAPIRRRIYQLAAHGHTPTAIAQALHLSIRTVRHLLQRMHDNETAALADPYARCGRPANPHLQPFVHEAIGIRTAHPTWGAGLVRVFLRRRHPDAELPSERTLQRWFLRSRLPAALPGRRPEAESQRARFPHEVWQIDAADQVRMQKGLCSWLRLVDECSGAFLRTVVFSQRLLGARLGRRGATSVAAGICRVGVAPARARGQRQAVGIVE
jgi:AraC-like DNA-binding protein